MQEALLRFVTDRVPYVYLSCLVIAIAYGEALVGPEDMARTVLQVSIKLTFVYLLVAAALGFVLMMPTKVANSLGVLYFFLLVNCVCAYYNLHLTALSHALTALKVFGQKDLGVLSHLFDATLSRGSRTTSLTGETVFALGQLAALRSGDSYALGGAAAATGLKATVNYFSGAICQNSYGGGFGTLMRALEPEAVEFKENVAGRFAWVLEDLLITKGSICGPSIGFGRVFLALFGVVPADVLFQAAVGLATTNTSPEATPEATRREAYVESVTLAAGPLRERGVVCTQTDLANLLRHYTVPFDPRLDLYEQGFWGFLQSREMPLLLQALNLEQAAGAVNAAKPGERTPWLERQALLEKRLPGAAALARIDDPALRQKVGATLRVLQDEDAAQAVLLDSVGFFDENRAFFAAMGCDLSHLLKAILLGELRHGDRVPAEHLRCMFGHACTIDGARVPERPDVKERIRYFLELFPSGYSDICAAGRASPCCDAEKRPFAPWLPLTVRQGTVSQQIF